MANGYPNEYEELVKIADDPQNVTSHIRRMFLFEDPYQGSTEEQNQAYRDLERLNCPSMAQIMQYLNDYLVLASRSGRAYISGELSEKLFLKMPEQIGSVLKTAFE